MNHNSPDILPFIIEGTVKSHIGPIIKATMLGVEIGDIVTIQCQQHNQLINIPAKVISFDKNLVTLSSFCSDFRIIPGTKVLSSQNRTPTIELGKHLLGSITDSRGNLCAHYSASPQVSIKENLAFKTHIPDPLSREKITDILETGIKVIDGFLTVGKGQRIAIFAEPGIGKSTLMSSIARHSKAEVNVIGLVGERGREILDFAESLPAEVRARTVIVTSTSNEPAISRVSAAQTATRIAEYFCSQNLDVLLQIDSLTRLFRAYRELGLAAGEVPVRRGYPPSVFVELPNLIERPGNFKNQGSITAFYTVLLSSDLDEDPMVEEIKGLTDGHFILKKSIFKKGIFPALDVQSSISRLSSKLLEHNDKTELLLAERNLLAFLERLEQEKEIFSLGGTLDNEKFQQSLALEAKIESFLKQEVSEYVEFEETMRQILELSSGCLE
ncbi:MAG: FliI/YscN family ATPase [Deltaproteobacteria bacterium]|jgi:flagellum-specific ATP synthase|nr:FliI/YscN family ATPase [Deltaproteobacteria bacterium]